MKCQKCGCVLQNDDFFCPECGTPRARCQKCGCVLQDDDFFCPECGTPKADSQTSQQTASQETVSSENTVPNAQTSYDNITPTEPNADSAVKSIISNKKVLIPIIAAAAVIIILAIIFIFKLIGSSESYPNINGITVFTVNNDDDGFSYIFSNGKIANKISAYKITDSYSFDYSSAAFSTYEYDIYYADSKNIIKIDSDASSYNVRISEDGSYVGYIKDDYLYIYDVSSKKSKRLENEGVIDFTLSPDGKSVLYSINNDDDTSTCYIYNGGNTTKIDGKNLKPIGIANNAKYVYYSKFDYTDYCYSLYVYKGNESSKLTNTFTGSVRANADLSEIIYASDKGSYICIKGQEPEKLCNEEILNPILPYGANNHMISDSMYTYDLKSLKNHVFYSYLNESPYKDSLRYVTYKNKEWSADKIASDVDSAYTSKDLSSVSYTKNHKLYYIKNVHKNPDDAVDIARDIYSFIPSSPNLKNFYVLNEEGTLSYVSQKDSKKIADDVYNTLCANTDGYIFFMSDDILYSSRNGSPKKKALEYVYSSSLYKGNNVLVTCNDDEYDLYANTSGDKFECVIKDY